MKKLLFTLALVLLGLSVYSNPTDTIPSQSNLYDNASIDDEGCCTIVDWRSTKLSQYTLHEVKLKNNCSYTVKISYKYRYDNGKLVPNYCSLGPGQSVWLPTGYEKRMYEYDED